MFFTQSFKAKHEPFLVKVPRGRPNHIWPTIVGSFPCDNIRFIPDALLWKFEMSPGKTFIHSNKGIKWSLAFMGDYKVGKSVLWNRNIMVCLKEIVQRVMVNHLILLSLTT